MEGRSFATLPCEGFWAAHGELAEVEGGRREEGAWGVIIKMNFHMLIFRLFQACSMHPPK